MKYIIFTVFLVLSYMFLDISEYRELNDVAIIEVMSIEKNNDFYTITLREKKSIKGSSGIEYIYEYYTSNSSSINGGLAHINKYTRKSLNYDHLDTIVTNINNISDELSNLEFMGENIIFTTGEINIKKSD